MSKSRTAFVAATLALTLSLGALPAPARAATLGTDSLPNSNPVQAMVQPAMTTGPLQKEVFGFAFGNASLADPTYGYSAWSFNLLSTVVYFGLGIRWDGTILQSGAAWTTWNSSTLTNLVNIAHSHRTRVILSINLQDFAGGPRSTMCAALHPLHRAVTVKQTLAQVQKMHVDGVNIDFEGVNSTCAYGPTTRSEMTSLAREMRAALPSAYLAVDTYGGSAADPYNFYDIKGMAPYVDSFFVMAYDMEYANQHRPPVSCGATLPLNCLGPTAPLSSYYYNLTTITAQYVAAAGAGKVILGVPYYGRKSCVSAGTHNAVPVGTITADSYLNASQESTDTSVRAGSYATHRDVYTGVERWDTWYNTTLSCTRELYWDDVYSLGRKYDLVLRNNLRGVGIFALQYGGGAPELWNLLAARFTTWSASYDLSAAPLGWQPGETKTFNVTVTNTSPATWPSDGTNYTALYVHFATASGGLATRSSWLGGQVFKLPADLPAGQSATIPVTLTAPDRSGTLWLETDMLRTGLYWFTAHADVQVRLASVLWFASYDVGAAPDRWKAGQAQSFTVNVKNTGNQSWPAGGTNPVALDISFARTPNGSTGISTWLSSKIFRLAADVAPGQSAAIPVSVTAPRASGPMYLQAQMFKNHQFWFGSSQPAAVSVGDAWLARYAVGGVPAAWSARQTQSFSVAVTNAGTQVWPAGGVNNVALHVHFTTTPGGSALMSSWLTRQTFKLPANVSPGQTVNVPVKVTAPSTIGPLYLEVQLFKNQQFWLPSFQPVPVSIGARQWSASYAELNRWPLEWSGGQSQAFTVIVKNTGTQSWPAGGTNFVALDMHFAAKPGTRPWLTSQIYRLPADVAPGQTAQIPVSVTAPTARGALFLEGSMFKKNQFWLPLAQPVSVDVLPTLWWSDSDLSAAPRAWRSGQTQSFNLVVENTGTQAWPSAGSNPVKLNLHFATRIGGSAVLSTWLTSQSFALPSDVAPGQSVTVTVSITAPKRAGLFYLEAQMFKDHQFWIQPWRPVAVTLS